MSERERLKAAILKNEPPNSTENLVIDVEGYRNEVADFALKQLTAERDRLKAILDEVEKANPYDSTASKPAQYAKIAYRAAIQAIREKMK